MSKISITGRLVSFSEEKTKSEEDFQSLKIEQKLHDTATGNHVKTDNYEVLVFNGRIDIHQIRAAVGSMVSIECFLNGKLNQTDARAFYNLSLSGIKMTPAYERSPRY